MLLQKKYTTIYTAYDDYGYLQLILYNEQKADALVFDGLNFMHKPSLTDIPSDYKKLKYGEKSRDTTYEVESVRQSGDLSFIKFANGDVFQLYFMMDDNESNQILSIFREEEAKHIRTPLGMNLYDAVLIRFSNAEECEITVEEW